MNKPIFGVDFSSAPHRKKPIWIAELNLDHDQPHFASLNAIYSLTDFQTWLNHLQNGVIGLDLPLGMPRKFIEHAQWPSNWADLICFYRDCDEDSYCATIEKYIKLQPQGHKLPKRNTDVTHKAISPMMIYGVPLAKMHFRGAPLLQEAQISVLPNNPTTSAVQAIEIYPAILAKRLFHSIWPITKGKPRYKSGNRKAAQRLRTALFDALQSRYFTHQFIPAPVREIVISDPNGDALDALFAAIQAYEAAQLPNFGIPSDADPLEGWICS